MCGRFTQLFKPQALISLFQSKDIDFEIDLNQSYLHKPLFNVTPSESVGVLFYKNHTPPSITYAQLEWGMPFSQTQSSSQQPKRSSRNFRIFNKRIETVDEKPFFKNLWNFHRLVVPISGWYEWCPNVTHGSIPYYFTRKKPLFLCGLGQPHTTTQTKTKTNPKSYPFAILTTASTGPAQSIHARMPLILPEELLVEWLQPQTIAANTFTALMAHQKNLSESLNIFPVSNYVNQARHKDARCIEPAFYDKELTLFS